MGPGRGTSFSWSSRPENVVVNMQDTNILWSYLVSHSSCGAMTWFSWIEMAVHRFCENLLLMWTKNWISQQSKGIRAWEFQNPFLHSSKTTRFSYWVKISFFGGAIEVQASLKDLLHHGHLHYCQRTWFILEEEPASVDHTKQKILVSTCKSTTFSGPIELDTVVVEPWHDFHGKKRLCIDYMKIYLWCELKIEY